MGTKDKMQVALLDQSPMLKVKLLTTKPIFCAKACTQYAAINVTWNFSPIVTNDSIVVMVDLEIIHFNVKATFVYRGITKIIYMEQSLGFTDINGFDIVCLVLNSLCRLHQFA